MDFSQPKGYENPLLLIGVSLNPISPWSGIYDFDGLINEGKGKANSGFLTQQGVGHISLSQTNDCLKDSILDYLLHDTLPHEECPPANTKYFT